MSSVALVTGGTSGIGAATARVLVSQGWQVVISGRNAAAAEALIGELGKEKVHFESADLEDPTVADRLVAAAVDRFGRLDALVAPDEWEARRAAWVAPELNHQTPWQEMYRAHVGQLAQGGCLELATAYRRVRESLPRDNH